MPAASESIQLEGLFSPEQLARLRRVRGLSQYELAKAVGCTVQSISNWESGRNQPSLTKLEHLYEALGVRSVLELTRRTPQ